MGRHEIHGIEGNSNAALGKTVGDIYDIRVIDIVKEYMSGLSCEHESGSCELTDCRTCRAVSLLSKLHNVGFDEEGISTYAAYGNYIFCKKAEISRAKEELTNDVMVLLENIENFWIVKELPEKGMVSVGWKLFIPL